MKSNSCSLRFKIIAFTITIFVISFIFVHSTMPADQSSTESQFVLNVLQPFLSLFNSGKPVSELFIRKLAHFSEFAALGFMLTVCAYSFKRKKTYKLFPNIAGAGLITALIDETIQLNVTGRSGMITDVWIDFSGVLTGTLIMLIIFGIYMRIRKR